MTGCEEQLHARAEMLDETGDLAAAVTEILAGASGAGVDPRAVTSLRAAIQALDPAGSPPAYHAGSQEDRRPGSGYGSDSEFLEAVSDAEDRITVWLRDVKDLAKEVTAAMDATLDDLSAAMKDHARTRADLAAAYAMAVREPCNGCHGEREAAITAAQAGIDDAEARINDAKRRAGICESCAEILDALGERLTAALARLRQVPADLGEIYTLVYEFIRGGGKLPRYARWIEGEGTR